MSGAAPGGAAAAGGAIGAPVRLAVIGVGNRGGDVYAQWCAEHPDQARVVAIADPDHARRRHVGDRHGLDDRRRHADWPALMRDLADVDGVIVATPDRCHVEPAEAALAAGRHLLLEKPIAATPQGVRRIAAAADASPATVTVAHVLRYTPFFSTIKELLDEGAVGRLAGVAHAEHIGFWHFAHSYVRGPWRRAADASPMILAKACHDLDILRWLIGAPCERIASEGALTHFRAEHRPPGAPDHCLDGCPVAASCPFDAGRLYLEQFAGWDAWPLTHLGDHATREERVAAVAHGPFGRCVYACDNDVADHYSTVLGFAGGVSATLTVSAFTRDITRTVRLMGSHGELRGDFDAGEIEVHRFVPRPGGARLPRDSKLSHTDTLQVGDPRDLGDRGDPGDPPGPGSPERVLGSQLGHAGGDAALMRDFIGRLRMRDGAGAAPAARTSLAESLDSHLMAFAAEEARARGGVVRLGEDHLTGDNQTTNPRS